MQHSEHVPLLLRFTNSICVTTDLNTQLSHLSELIKESMDVETCLLFVHLKEQRTLWKRPEKRRGEIKIHAEAHAPSLPQEQQIVLALFREFLQPNPSAAFHMNENSLTLPLLGHRNELIGMVHLQGHSKGEFTNKSLELLRLIGACIGIPLENALLYHKVRTSQAKIINKLSEAAEFKDDEAHTHAKRIGLYAEVMARNLGLDEEFCALIKLTAPMHDIGKIGIAESIIQKPGPLSEEEFTLMKRHTLIGHDLLADPEDEALTMAANIARDHHEKFAGGGYPYDKKGEEISLEGRITAVADVFDVLTSKRPYKAAWSIDRAFGFIQNLREKHFDPEVADAFLKNQEEIHFIRVSFED
ncbi:MAG: HD domain-containing protein [Campylobacterales bacterium]|nr:HD domain-containing protein [Campylobacterales bacterium]